MKVEGHSPGRLARGHQSGQAAVESALIFPLVVFLLLGTLQLFLMMQARLLAQYAVSRAARAGSLNFGNCRAMNESAVAVLLPAFDSFLRSNTDGRSAEVKYVEAFRRWKDNDYGGRPDGHIGNIVWLYRDQPLREAVRNTTWWEMEEDFDLPESQQAPRAVSAGPRTLELRMVFWYPLRIPFANWVIHRAALARFGLREFRGTSPLTPVKKDVVWDADPTTSIEGIHYSGNDVAREMLRRAAYSSSLFVLPIEVTSVTRFMTPPRIQYFLSQHCFQPPGGP